LFAPYAFGDKIKPVGPETCSVPTRFQKIVKALPSKLRSRFFQGRIGDCPASPIAGIESLNEESHSHRCKKKQWQARRKGKLCESHRPGDSSASALATHTQFRAHHINETRTPQIGKDSPRRKSSQPRPIDNLSN
jgi:hypothetical protein